MTTPLFVFSLLALPYRLLSWLLVSPIFVRLGDSSALFAFSGRFLCCLVCRFSVTSFSFFLSLLSSSLFLFLSLSWSPFASLLLSLASSSLRSHLRLRFFFLVVSFVSFVFLFSSFTFFVLSSFSFLFSCPFLISSVTWFLPLVVSWCNFGLVLRLLLLFLLILIFCLILSLPMVLLSLQRTWY